MNFTETHSQLRTMHASVKHLQRELNELDKDIRAALRLLRKGFDPDARAQRLRTPAKTPRRPRRDRSSTVATAASKTTTGVDHTRRERE